MGSKISNVEYFLPSKVLNNIDLEEKFKTWSSEKIEKKTGVRERHIAFENETALDLAFSASKKIMSKYDSAPIDFILFCTQSPDYYLPANACILQDRLDLPKSIGAMDFNLGCSGFIYGLAVAKGLIASGMASNILFVTSETYSKHINENDKSNLTIFGDAAVAVIVSVSDKEKIGEFVLGTDGSGFENLIVPNGGLKNRFNPDAQLKIDESGSGRTLNDLYMNGPEIFNFTIKAVPEVVENVLEKNNTSLKDIDYVIFHQANKYIIEYLRKKLNIPEHKFYVNLINTGNTVSCTIPIALKNSMEESVIKKGSHVLLVGFGVGYSWGATVITI
ncbi:ketoacyl-ACP synthase III [bacterium]|nr:ketoacyl-ACP synthase III [bacterium]